MTETFTRIAGVTILTADAENTIIEDGDLWLSGGRIAAAGAAGSFTPPAPSR